MNDEHAFPIFIYARCLGQCVLPYLVRRDAVLRRHLMPNVRERAQATECDFCYVRAVQHLKTTM